MLLFLKKKSEETENTPEIPAAEQRQLHDFIPYYCHYNPHTLLTKNGELMQTIRINSNALGLTYENNSSDEHTVREYVRKTMSEVITSNHYALWIHTIRKRKHVHYDDHYNNDFALHVHDCWQQKYHWKFQYYNEIYISIVREGQHGEMVLDKHALNKAALPKHNRRYRNAYLDQAYAELNETVTAMLDRMRTHYRADRLSMVERSVNAEPAIFYSEPLEFLGTLLNLRKESFPVCEIDISKELVTHQLKFGFNAMESAHPSGHRRFGALLSLKQYREVHIDVVDRLLQAPVEFIVSQAIVYTPARRALKEYKTQKELLEMSGDTYSATASGLEEMLQGNHNLPTDYADVQTAVMVLTDEYRNLDAEILKVQQAFGDMGLITVREDIKLEECFWSQLPGNFEFIRRKDTMRTARTAGFCRLNLFPGGTDSGNHWGAAVTLIPTQVNSPYFFNFHHQDNGHTLLFDFNSFHDSTGSVLSHFLLTSAMKYQGRIFMFDRNRAGRLWCDKVKGQYHTFQTAGKKRARQALAVNPFSLEDSKRNRSFLLAWCAALVEPHYALEEAHKELLISAIERLYALPKEERNLAALADTLAADDYQFASAFRAFYGSGKYAGLFDAATDGFDSGQPLHGFSMDELLRMGVSTVPMFAYLLHRIINGLDGKPTIIVLHEAFDLLENAFIAPRLESLLEILKQNNAMLLCTASRPETCTGKHTFKTLSEGCATHLYVPDDVALDYAQTLPLLSERDSRFLSKMDRQRGDFLLKQNHESIALCVNLDDMDDIRSILANDVKTLIAAGGKFASLPEAYENPSP